MEKCYIYNEDTKRLSPAKNPIKVNGQVIVNPTPAQYALAGLSAYPIGAAPAPETPEGKVAVVDGYELIDGKWSAVYRFDDLPHIEQLVIPSTPTQAQVADVVKKIVVLHGGIVEENAS